MELWRHSWVHRRDVVDISSQGSLRQAPIQICNSLATFTHHLYVLPCFHTLYKTKTRTRETQSDLFCLKKKKMLMKKNENEVPQTEFSQQSHQRGYAREVRVGYCEEEEDYGEKTSNFRRYCCCC